MTNSEQWLQPDLGFDIRRQGVGSRRFSSTTCLLLCLEGQQGNCCYFLIVLFISLFNSYNVYLQSQFFYNFQFFTIYVSIYIPLLQALLYCTLMLMLYLKKVQNFLYLVCYFLNKKALFRSIRASDEDRALSLHRSRSRPFASEHHSLRAQGNPLILFNDYSDQWLLQATGERSVDYLQEVFMSLPPLFDNEEFLSVSQSAPRELVVRYLMR